MQYKLNFVVVLVPHFHYHKRIMRLTRVISGGLFLLQRDLRKYCKILMMNPETMERSYP